jgi:ankyrin repeat protein
MTDSPSPAPLSLPERPDLRHLKDQARDLLRSGDAASLAAALHAIARRYGFSSWPKLKSHVESLHELGALKEAIDREDLAAMIELMTRNPELHRAPLGYNRNGPLTWVAECRVPWKAPSQTRLAMARWMLVNGSDVHQGGDGPLMRAALNDVRIPMMELLVEYGADVNARWDGSYPIICAPCEALAPNALRWLLQHGADPNVDGRYGLPTAMVVGSYSRNAAAKHACLEALVEAGCPLPDIPAMALHRGRRDILQRHLSRDPGMLSRRLSGAEIYPPSMGMKPDDGLTSTPVGGATLLHLAVEFDDFDTAAWLLDHGADPNARAGGDVLGHTPLFHTAITMGQKHDALAQLLLRHGADPGLRATVRKQLRDMGDAEKEQLRVYERVTPVEYARAYVEPDWLNDPALAVMAGAPR